MSHDTQTRHPYGAALPDAIAATLRRVIAERGPRHLAEPWGLSAPALARAAAGARVTRGTRVLIELGLQRLRDAGELPAEAAP